MVGFRPSAAARDRAVALGFAALYLALLLWTASDLGYARDEGFYFHAAGRYQAWFELLGEPRAALARIDEFWSTNPEHPGLIKSLFALSHLFFWDEARLFGLEGTSLRFPAMALSSLAVGLAYLWGARALSRLAGVVAAVSLAAMPHVFHHAHMACFDMPVVTVWMLCAYCYWRAVEAGGAARVALTGLSFGLALATKHNAWFLPIVLAIHAAALFAARDRERSRRAFACLVAMAIAGPVVLLATWPWLWRDTIARLTFYVEFHLDHVFYNMEFLGRNYFEPPFPRGYAPLMTAATVPATTLVAFLVGLVVCTRRSLLDLRARRRGEPAPARDAPATGDGDAVGTRAPLCSAPQAPVLLWLLAIVVPYSAWLSPTTPIFGGTKHWMTAYPFIALFAAAGVQAAIDALVTMRGPRREWAVATLTTLVTLPSIVETAHVHPWTLSSYSPLVGGAAGGADLGLNRGFWGYTTGKVAPYIDEAAPPKARVYIHDTAWPSWEMHQRDGRLRADLRATGDLGDADMALYHHELHMAGVEYQAWIALGSAVPSHIAGLDGVPVIWIFERPGARLAARRRRDHNETRAEPP